MAVQNDFLAFSVGNGANVLSQADYANLAAVATGFQSGTAQSAACNKVWRQSSIMSAVIAQFIVSRTNQPVVDDGTTATILQNLLASTAANGGDPTVAFQVAAATSGNQAPRLSQVVGMRQAFTSSGSFTVPIGITTIWVSGCSAGGGGGAGGATAGHSTLVGGGGGGGGGAGQSLQPTPYAVTPGQVIAITIGAGGIGASAPGSGDNAGGNGTSGGTTIVGSLVSLSGAGGGFGGGAAAANQLGSGGAGGNGGVGFPGGSGGLDSNYTGNGGAGASGGFGGGGGSGRAGAGASPVGGMSAAVTGNYGGGGGGGGGAYGTNAEPGSAGGNGASGFILIEW
ncbi:phage tail protein [Burkholderia cenocepacia]|uniref:glycine-rich domain-containing protein n=1 Tax=Burkholderia cenocepacia TaxID=95486 RepID=UPI0021AB0C14|nr:phage tail protein [Burkholderia cenocepacia]